MLPCQFLPFPEFEQCWQVVGPERALLVWRGVVVLLEDPEVEKVSFLILLELVSMQEFINQKQAELELKLVLMGPWFFLQG